MSTGDLNMEAKRLYQELENGQIDREQYYGEIVGLLCLALYPFFTRLWEFRPNKIKTIYFNA